MASNASKYSSGYSENIANRAFKLGIYIAGSAGCLNGGYKLGENRGRNAGFSVGEDIGFKLGRKAGYLVVETKEKAGYSVGETEEGDNSSKSDSIEESTDERLANKI